MLQQVKCQRDTCHVQESVSYAFDSLLIWILSINLGSYYMRGLFGKVSFLPGLNQDFKNTEANIFRYLFLKALKNYVSVLS